MDEFNSLTGSSNWAVSSPVMASSPSLQYVSSHGVTEGASQNEFVTGSSPFGVGTPTSSKQTIHPEQSATISSGTMYNGTAPILTNG
jgi:hypothetical protein